MNTRIEHLSTYLSKLSVKVSSFQWTKSKSNNLQNSQNGGCFKEISYTSILFNSLYFQGFAPCVLVLWSVLVTLALVICDQ